MVDWVVILESPAVESLPDARLAAMVDNGVLVVAAARTARMARFSAERIRSDAIRILGVVVSTA